MKKDFQIIVYLFLLFSFTGFTQNKKKDTVKTEVIRVDTKYNPKIADANKVKAKPVINLGDKNQKKDLSYSIFSVPVASTYIPKSGIVKGYNPGKKERLYDNYLAAGFGNYSSPFLEAFVKRKIKYVGEIGFSTNYLASLNNIENTVLDSDFSNLSANLYFKKEERFYDWKVGIATELQNYNWYGIAPNLLTPEIASTIDGAQNYNFVRFNGQFNLFNSFFSSSNLSISNFSDGFNSNEILLNLDSEFAFMLGLFKRDMKDLAVHLDLEYLSGTFDMDYNSGNELNYSIFTASLHPVYEDIFGNFSIRAGAKVFASMDMENEINNFLFYPDFKIETPIIKDNLNIFIGATGGLTTNTYRSFVGLNPFVAPSLAITQTSETYNAFGGFKGILNNAFSFNVSAHLIEEEDKPLLIRNNSKFDGANAASLLGYEFGNSFSIIYDDVKTLRISTEVNYDFNRYLSVGANAQFDSFTMTNQMEAWNLPTLQASLFGKYTSRKWYMSAQFFYVGERNDVSYSAIYPAMHDNIPTKVEGFLDFNMNGGYHLNDKFSLFLRLNNIFDAQYQIFNNFEVQGLQILGGMTYKFDL